MAEEKPPKPFFEFIRERVVPVNAVIVLSGFVVAALDFLAPRAPYLKSLGIALSGLVLMMMVLELGFPAQVDKWIKATSKGLPAFLNRMRMGHASSLHSPAWQVLGVIAVVVFGLGQASAAKASVGGLLASQFPSIASLQSTMLGMRDDLKDIKEKLKNVKQETSSDPRKELANLAIPWSEAGLEQAVANQDVKAIKLFAQANFQSQKRSGIIVGKAIESKNDGVIEALQAINLSPIYLQPMGLTYFVDDKEKTKPFGCEYVVYSMSNLQFKMTGSALKIIKKTCQKEMTSGYVEKQNLELKQWALKNKDEYWLGWANDVDKFNSLVR